MQNNNQYPHFSDEVGDRNMHHNPYASGSSFDALFPPCAKLPYHGVELQPSEVCPKNFVIFDQTYDHSQVMYHPELTHKLMNNPSLNALASTFQNEYGASTYQNEYAGGSYYGNYDQEVSSSHQEDPNEIDALLSADEDYEEDDNEGHEEGDSEEVSTARNSYRDYGNSSAESCCSSYGYNNNNNSNSNNNSRKQSLSGSASSNNDGKGRRKMKKMMGVLRRIVPGGEQMNTASVLDEAVQYLKSLKFEAQKLGVGHYSNQS
ncbi:PREDICTED: transcription factor bHLH144-like [Camelina sativa]|uniref:Transcription factor bHLH144-like n=1 Tax=Camelina sativa TaxID=90675 RepID=A0ABM0YDY4_CAMSA|nr:PREDICTED: transcription factor bHLH144-like [Camelina sativa]